MLGCARAPLPPACLHRGAGWASGDATTRTAKPQSGASRGLTSAGVGPDEVGSSCTRLAGVGSHSAPCRAPQEVCAVSEHPGAPASPHRAPLCKSAAGHPLPSPHPLTASGRCGYSGDASHRLQAVGAGRRQRRRRAAAGPLQLSSASCSGRLALHSSAKGYRSNSGEWSNVAAGANIHIHASGAPLRGRTKLGKAEAQTRARKKAAKAQAPVSEPGTGWRYNKQQKHRSWS